MSRLLPAGFSGQKYGLTFRLVEEGDAEFIYTLRSNPELNRYIHDVDGGVEGQLRWIRGYKKREEEGTDYYFIYFKDGAPVGLYRIYDIHGKVFTGGSWVMVPDPPLETVLAVPLIAKEIAFETLGMELDDEVDGVHVDNKKVIKFSKMFGFKETGRISDVKGEYVTMSLTREDFEAAKPSILKHLRMMMGNQL
ncbi:MAG: GNAT family N-acetyltransferase [Bacteroidales bacterium]|nr:GNAT family N-acetyltransferase [Bacteroidales bacterium]